MILIFGGAYQGKLDIAVEEAKKLLADKTEITISDCLGGETPDFEKDIIYGIEDFALECVKNNIEAKTFFEENEAKWQDKILVMTDVSQGVVPIDRDVRAFREMNGRLMIYLAKEADRVIRVFCGIGKDIK